MTRNLRILMGVAFGNCLAYYAFANFLSAYLRDSGIPVLLVGFFFSLSSAVEAPVDLMGGVLADTLGRRVVLGAGRALRLVGWLIVLLLGGDTWLVLAALFLGLGGLAGSGYKALIAESAAAGRRASAFGAIGVVENAVGVFVPLIVGYAADQFGLRPVLVVAAVTGTAVTLFFIARLTETMAGRGGLKAGGWAPAPVAPSAAEGALAGTGDSPQATVVAAAAGNGAGGAEGSVGIAANGAGPADTGKVSPLAGFRFLFGPEGRGAAMMTVIWLFTGFTVGMMGPLWGLYVTDRFATGYAGIGYVSVAIAVGSIVGMAAGGRIADRIGNAKLMLATLSVTCPLWLIIPLALVPWVLYVMVLVNSLGVYSSAPAWEALSADAARRKVRGSINGIYAASQAVGMMIGAAALGVLYAKRITLPFYVLGANELLLAALIISGVRWKFRGFGWGKAGAAQGH